jgi:hypothetical protein
MSAMIEFFLLVYLLSIVLVTILSVTWFLTAIFKLEMRTKRALLIKYHNHKST